MGKNNSRIRISALRRGAAWAVVGAWAVLASRAEAGVFNTIQYLEPGRFSVGFEPEFVLSNGAGLGGTAWVSAGLNDLSNVSFLLGSGGGPRRFRTGVNVTADFFPDVDAQPGIGVALQALYATVSVQSAGTNMVVTGGDPTQGRFEVTAIPYIHKNFQSRGGDVEPFLAFPVGASIRDSRLQSTTAIAVGSFFNLTPQVKVSMELDVGLSNAESTLSGGAVYRFR